MSRLGGTLLLVAALGWCAAAGPAAGGTELPVRVTVYVNNATGSDAWDGLGPVPADGGSGPVATITRGIALAPTGALISIANTGKDYRESVRVDGHAPAKPDAVGPRPARGVAGLPLVLDGHGAAVSGLVTVPAERWTRHADDVVWFENRDADGKAGPMPNSNWLGFQRHQGWFTEPQAPEIFFVDGQPAPHVKSLEAIPPGGFFYDTLAKPRRLYFRLPAGKALADLCIDVPLNEGVFIDADYVVVRNLQSRYSQDDGFAGFWGYGVVFENCNGSFNCDQGISLHGTSVTLIDGGLFERNGGCGIADVMSCTTIYRNCVVRDNKIAGAVLNGAMHSLSHCRFGGNEGAQVAADQGAFVYLHNTVVDGAASLLHARVERCTVTGALTLRAGGRLEQCLLGGDPALSIAPEAIDSTTVRACFLAGNTLRWGADAVAPDAFAAYVKERRGWSQCSMQPLPLAAPDFALPAEATPEGVRFGAVLPVSIGWRP
jgi:hypothetical protein